MDTPKVPVSQAPEGSVRALEDRLARLAHLRHRTMNRYFRSIGLFNGHPMMLFHLRRQPGITQKELAEVMEISPSSVTISVKRMESAGLVRRQADEADGRVMHLFLTPEGEAMDEACKKGRDFMCDHLYGGITPEERHQLCRLLDIITINMEMACDTLPAPDETGKDELI